MSTTFSQLFKRNIKLCCNLILNKFYHRFNSIKTSLFHLNNQQKAFAVGLSCMTSSSRGTSGRQHPTGTAQALPLRTKRNLAWNLHFCPQALNSVFIFFLFCITSLDNLEMMQHRLESNFLNLFSRFVCARKTALTRARMFSQSPWTLGWDKE